MSDQRNPSSIWLSLSSRCRFAGSLPGLFHLPVSSIPSSVVWLLSPVRGGRGTILLVSSGLFPQFHSECCSRLLLGLETKSEWLAVLHRCLTCFDSSKCSLLTKGCLRPFPALMNVNPCASGINRAQSLPFYRPTPAEHGSHLVAIREWRWVYWFLFVCFKSHSFI